MKIMPIPGFLALGPNLKKASWEVQGLVVYAGGYNEYLLLNKTLAFLKREGEKNDLHCFLLANVRKVKIPRDFKRKRVSLYKLLPHISVCVLVKTQLPLNKRKTLNQAVFRMGRSV